ncbi:hypothetical protein M7I_0039 [Glarea lozoyensis 74030]|uniref:DUF8021 domain-containing protein n=1 Tax=Glarea lozoyensis (strain ATCC 74030 / MF5533) TaxID=1104152 RepID=H0ECA6_GLAL7|nr:hypothetical protein M7I_0039 [Glarea lozoyensis 74030]
MITSFVLLGLAARALSECTREVLITASNAYISAQSSGSLTTFNTLSANLTYLENNITVTPSTSLLATPIKIDFNRTIHDTVLCRTYIELTAATNPHPYVISTALYLTDDKITYVDSVVADAGDWAFNATGHLTYTKSESWPSIPPSAQLPRAQIQAAADAYLDSWGNGSVPVPYGTPCARLEGGSYTDTKNSGKNTCKMPEFPKPFYAGNRRYIVDVEMGAVAVFNDFPFIEKTKPAGTPSVNFVRVEGGSVGGISHEQFE